MKSPLLAIRSIVRLTDKILWLAYDDRYTMCMTWLRVAEFRESPEDQFKVGHFKLLDYMDWYAHGKGKGLFSYPDDWSGFNLEASWLRKMYVDGKDKIPDWNDYDSAAEGILRYAEAACGGNWALCATLAGKFGVLKHEIAHSLWATEPEYEAMQRAVIGAAPPELVNAMRENLFRFGYGRGVLDDEIQAYLSADTSADMTRGLPKPDVAALRKALRENFRPRYDNILPNIPRG